MATALALPEKVFHNGDSFFEGLLRDLDRAKASIDFEAYIFENDALGRLIANALKAAAQRGVRVRLLVDGVGSPNFHVEYLPEFLRAGVDCRVYHPFPWKLLWGRVSRLPSVRSFFTLLGKINQRNHRKVYLLDGRTAWLGSMNVSACHLEQIRGASAWRDTGVRIEGERVSHLQAAFESAWNEAWAFRRGRIKHWWRHRRQKAHPLVRLNDTSARRDKIYRDLVRRIAGARDKVWITSAYFVPRTGLVRALCQAGRNGADVRILLPSECDVFFIPWVSSAFYKQLLDSSVRIYEYQGRMVHAKTLLIDNWATVGSSNLNHRSLKLDLEVDVVLTTPEARRSIAEQFQIDLSHAREVRLEEWKKRPWLERLACRTLLLIKHWV